jgi:hypothetical protein
MCDRTLVAIISAQMTLPLAQVEGDPFAVGPWFLPLARARRIRPVPFKGQVSRFDVPERLLMPLEPPSPVWPR